MPELPEVETVRRGLEPVLSGAEIVAAKVNRADLRFPFPDDFANRLAGRRITALGRRAKYLLLHLSDDEIIISHLGMSGSWRIEDETLGQDYHAKGKLTVHDHFTMQIVKSDGQHYRIVYNDPRRFGFMLLCDTANLHAHPMLAKLGIEPTGNALSGAYLRDAFANKKAPLKAALLDQSIIAGLGNIYVCEALWRSRLSPKRAASTLAGESAAARKHSDLLAQNIRDVIAEAIIAGGSSLRDYVQTDGSLGYFQHQFSVYDREGEPCPQCARPIARMVQSGRSSFYCSACQK